MNVLSLFDGISCGHVALERAGIKVDKYYASEIKSYAIQVTQKHFPDTIQLGDVCKISYVPDIDILIGGSPCQDLSIAKTDRKGLMGERSKLFWEYVRLLKSVKPRYFFFENVGTMKQSDKEIITSILGVEPIFINSALVSAQDRKRYYWTNIPNVSVPEDKGIMLNTILEPEENVPDKYYISTEKALVICDKEVSRRKIAYIGKDSQGSRVYSIHGKSVTISALGGGWGAKTGLYWIPCLTPDRIDQRQNGRRFKENNAKFYTLTAQDKHGVLTQGRIRKLTPLECERLQTLPDNYTEGLSDTKRIECCGDGWTVDVIAHIFKNIIELKIKETA